MPREPQVELAGRLTALSGMDRVFFANSGAEANEGAIKLARKWGAKHRGGAFEIITTERGFHGLRPPISQGQRRDQHGKGAGNGVLGRLLVSPELTADLRHGIATELLLHQIQRKQQLQWRVHQ